MKQKVEVQKEQLCKINEIKNFKENPIVGEILLAPLKAIPVLGDFVDASTEKILNDFQQKKEEELLNIILQEDYSITSDMVNDVEFIINFARVREAVARLATADKIEYFGNLIRNGYLKEKRIQGNVFDEYIHILDSMSYREIKCLADYKEYCDALLQNSKVMNFRSRKSYYNKYIPFCREYVKKTGMSIGEINFIFIQLKKTGFIKEVLETESSDRDQKDGIIDLPEVKVKGYYITQAFVEFYQIVCKRYCPRKSSNMSTGY